MSLTRINLRVVRQTMTAAICAALLAGCGNAQPNEPFDSSRWQGADLMTRTRAAMVRDLLKRHPLEGQTQDAILALLGAPTPTDKWLASEMVYVLGPDPGIGIDHEWLLIELDANQVVVGHSIVQD
jgi:hypothetical protein